MRRTTTALLPALALVSSLALAGCGGGGDDTSKTSASPSSSSSTPAAPETNPMTGLDVPDGGSAIEKHPVLVVKMDNTYASAPQLGLGSADLVVEELVEGGLTRLAAFYYSTLPGKTGPVRSMRASDIGIVSPVKADVVTSGAAGVTIRRIQGAGITFFGEGSKGFARDSSRSAPYNLFTDLRQTATLTKAPKERPADYLPWGSADDLPGGVPARTIAATFSGGHTTDWTFQGGKYVNTNSNAAENDRLNPDTVLVLRVQVGDAGYLDPAGNPVPETKLVGKGQAMLFHGGRLVRGTWSKADLDSPIELSTKAGPLTVPAGHTWIELVPASGGNVTYRK
ncbi:hypothetical protein GCM10022215_17140 [Nocardioides fonticola]|uniref:DUF3048 domain-containing protein n=1 Tax=Nocardioides fonticola TaxID=450363 RepID=A0ABP7XIE2_9ACTN